MNGISGERRITAAPAVLLVWLLVTVAMPPLGVSLAIAESARPETGSDLTPGPRMIRFLEQIAREYEAREHALNLSGPQRRAIADLLRDVKKEMWLKEATLVSIFQALEDKRRYGQLESSSDYRTANTLTGAIETDELMLFIDGLKKLQHILTPEQRTRLVQLWQPRLTLRVGQGMTTQIALLSLEGIGRLYHNWREELHLTDDQAARLQALLQEGRAELLRLGTVVDINRVEGDDLALRPDVDPEELREKMATTGDLEAGVFSRLFELASTAEGLLNPEQQIRLRELKRGRVMSRVASSSGYGHRSSPAPTGHGGGHSRHSTVAVPAGQSLHAFDFFLDQIMPLDLTEEQVERLLHLKEEFRQARLLTQAKVKGLELDVLAEIQAKTPEGAQVTEVARRPEAGVDLDGAAGTKAASGYAPALQQLASLRASMLQAELDAYLRARDILTPEQRRRVRPLETLGESD